MGWNDREIHAKEDEDYFNESDEEEEIAEKDQSINGTKVKLTGGLYQKEKSDQPTPISTPNISLLKIESNNVSRSSSSEKLTSDRLLSKKHGLEKIADYEDCENTENEHYDYIFVGNISNNY